MSTVYTKVIELIPGGMTLKTPNHHFYTYCENFEEFISISFRHSRTHFPWGCNSDPMSVLSLGRQHYGAELLSLEVLYVHRTQKYNHFFDCMPRTVESFEWVLK